MRRGIVKNWGGCAKLIHSEMFLPFYGEANLLQQLIPKSFAIFRHIIKWQSLDEGCMYH